MSTSSTAIVPGVRWSRWWQALLLAVALVAAGAAAFSPARAAGDGTAVAWGDGSSGQLGDGNAWKTAPVAVDTAGALDGKTVNALSAGDDHTCAVADGKAYCWGSNDSGQLGNNSSSDSAVPVAVDTTGVLAGKTITDISAAGGHSCAVAGGKAYCWGSNDSGQLGNNSTDDSAVPVAVDTTGVLAGKTITDIAAGSEHTCAIASSKAYCWGWGYSGMLGNNSTTDSAVPVAVDTTGVLAGKTITAVTTGGFHSCAVAGGKAYCWGDGFNGQLGNNSTDDSVVPVAVDTTGVLAGETVTELAAGSDHTCAVADGKAYCWGDNDSGQLGNNSANNSVVPVAVDTTGVLAGKTVTDVTAGASHTCAVADGKAHCWGYNDYGRLGNNSTNSSAVPVAVDTTGVLAGKTITAVTAGWRLSCALGEGRAFCWGFNDGGQLGNNGANDSEVPVAVDTTGVLAGKIVTEVSAGYEYACAVADGKAYCWGMNDSGQLGNNSANNSEVPVAVDTTGVLDGKTVNALSAGDDHTCAVADGKAYCWGMNDSGQLGNNSANNSEVPVAVDTTGVLAGKTVTEVSAGGSQTCAVAAGKAYCWGYGGNGQLGNGGFDSSVPVAVDTTGVLAGKTITDITAGGDHTCAVADGKAYCWGSNEFGRLGNDSTSSSEVPVAVDTTGVLAGKTVTAVSAGGQHTCAVANSKAYCWGYGGDGELGDNSNSITKVPVAVDTTGVLAGKSVEAMSASWNHTCAVADGRAYCWGSGSRGQLGNSDDTDSAVPVAVDTTGVLAGKAVTAVSASYGFTMALYGGTATATVPDAPTGVSGASGDGQVSVSWSAPADDGGSPILGYEATASPGGKTCTTDGTTTCTVTGLTNGQAYTFTVKARNDQGWSTPSAASPAVTPQAAVVSPPATQPPATQPPVTEPPAVTTPAAVSGVKAVARKGKVTVTWKAASGASSYKVRITKPGGKKYLAWKSVTATKFTAKVTKGKKYRVQILPVGTGGQGPTKTIKFKGH